MESWKYFQVVLHLLVRIELILVVLPCCRAHSSLNEVGHSDSYGEPKHEYEKYIMKPYFEKYDSLQDSDFKAFTDHELFFGSGEGMPGIINQVPRTLSLERSLIGEGSHRRLTSTIKFDIKSELVSQLPKHVCKIIYIEKLPSGVFADPFELQLLLQRGGYLDAVVFGDTNLELPSFLSNRSLVEVHMDIDPNVLSRLTNRLDINIELPLHARYLPLVESGYSNVEFSAPDFFMSCDTKEKAGPQSCLLKIRDDDSESRIRVIWVMPSGIETQAQVVSVVTFTIAILSTLSIALSSIYYSDFKICNILKEC